MKKILLPLLLALGLSFSLCAQSPFEGTITMNMEFTGDPNTIGMMKSMMPNKIIVRTAGNGSYTSHMQGGMFKDQYTLHDAASNTTYMVNPTKKTAQRLQQNTQADQQQLANAQITPLNETESIAGYNCGKYQVLVNNPQTNEPIKFYIWTSPEVAANYSMGAGPGKELMKKLNGAALKIEMPPVQQPGMPTPIGMQMVTTSVKKESIPPAEFLVPSDYQVSDAPAMPSHAFPGIGGH